MAARVTQVVVEAIIPLITRSPTTPTGAGVTQVVVEAMVDNLGSARVTQVVLEAIVSFNPDGSHGDPGGGGSPSATTHAFGYAV
jgi:hypothetical protein